MHVRTSNLEVPPLDLPAAIRDEDLAALYLDTVLEEKELSRRVFMVRARRYQLRPIVVARMLKSPGSQMVVRGYKLFVNADRKGISHSPVVAGDVPPDEEACP